jgi:Co/Zn/Cd efflux system component
MKKYKSILYFAMILVLVFVMGYLAGSLHLFSDAIRAIPSGSCPGGGDGFC